MKYKPKDSSAACLILPSTIYVYKDVYRDVLASPDISPHLMQIV